MFYFVLSVHAILCAALVGIVLLQQGKGADAGVVMGANAANSILGAGSAGSFISRLTTGLAIAFMITSILLVKSYESRVGMVTDPLANSVINTKTEEPAKAVEDTKTTEQK